MLLLLSLNFKKEPAEVYVALLQTLSYHLYNHCYLNHGSLVSIKPRWRSASFINLASDPLVFTVPQVRIASDTSSS